MNLGLSRSAALLLAVGTLSAASPVAAHPNQEDTYTITSVLQIARPVNPADMNDDFQDAKLISQEADSCTVEVTYYPFASQPIGENPHWRRDDARMKEYLEPTPSENWDEPMRQELLKQLAFAGIDPSALTDQALVQAVSQWAMRRAKTTNAFGVWCVYYPGGKPAVYEPLRAAFERQKPNSDWTDQQMFDRENLGRSMFYDKVHGSCTSSSIYLSTIFRALGIPTRVVFCIPPFDPNDAAQAKMFYSAVVDNQVRETVRAALAGSGGFDNHLFNEVYVGGRWTRLNYTRLGQPILDASYFGLLTHIYTCADMSQVPLAQTWGMRMYRYRDVPLALSSVNPYRLVSIHDAFGANAQIDNPPAPPSELKTQTITAALQRDSQELPGWVRTSMQRHPDSADLVLCVAEYLPTGSSHQMRAFLQQASHDFVLRAAGHPDVGVRLTGTTVSAGKGDFQAYMAKVRAEDRANLVPGVGYSIEPIDNNKDYCWATAPGLAPLIFAAPSSN